MRTRIAGLIAAILAGCAYPPSSTDTGIIIGLDTRDCIVAANPDVLLRIRNTSSVRIAFHVYGPSDPPYNLYPGSVQLLDAASGEPWQVVLEHFVPATHEVALQPGEQADFSYVPRVWPSSGEKARIKLRLRDTHGRFHYSSEQGTCHPG